MTDKKTKFFNKLSRKEYDKVIDVYERILLGEIEGINVKPLVGHKDVFRARVGRVRIIFIRRDDKHIVLHVVNRDDKTYKNL